MPKLKHDSQSEKYRWPQGARPCGSCVRLRISAPEGANCTLRLWTEKGEEKLPMRLRGYMDDAFLYEITLTLPEEPVILWYTFLVDADGEMLWYGNNPEGLGGEGQVSPHLPPSFQITVYDRAYTVPSWMHDGVMYQIFVDRFCDGGAPLLDKKPGLVTHASWDEKPNEYSNAPLGSNLGHDFFGGNLAGVIQKLPYLRKLGVTVLYLNPIFDAQSNHKYDTGDYTHVDPTFGTNEDFVRLCRAARANGIRVMLDGVFSHTGDNSVYFNRYGLYDSVGAYQSKDSPYASWYRFHDYPEEYDCWWGVKTLPEVDENCRSYRDFIIYNEDSVVAQWIARGASGWRLDVADELPDDFICELRARVKLENPEAAVLGEVWEDASNKVAYGQLRSYALGRSLDSVMNYPLRTALLNFFTGRGTARDFARTVNSLHENYPPQMFYALMNLIGSHDRARALNALSGLSGEDAPKETWRVLELDGPHYRMARQRLMALFALVCALPGMPTIYYGDEAGMQGAGDPYNRGTYPWGHEDQELIAFYARTIARRRAEPLWRRGALALLAPHPDVLLVVRRVENGRDALGERAHNGCVLFAINRSQTPLTLLLDPNDPRLAPFARRLGEIALPPLTPIYFKA